MKQAICNLKGVSTLEVLNNKLRIFLLVLIGMALSITIYGGFSILDFVDPGFNPQIQIRTFGTKTVYKVEPLSNGKILVAGQFNSYNNQTVSGLVRLNADASLDSSFTTDTIDSSSTVVKLIPMTDGKSVVCGNLTIHTQSGNQPQQIVRVNSDGTLDMTPGFTVEGIVTDCAVDASGRILVSRRFEGNSSSLSRVIRISANGSLDTSFQLTYGQAIDRVERIAMQNNKVIVGLATSAPLIIQRFNEDGTTDTSFTPQTLNGAFLRNLIVQPDAKILVLDSSNLLRLNESGGSDGSFTSSFVNTATAMCLSNDGRITVAYGTVKIIKRFLADGTTDSSFTPYTTTNYGALGVQTDGSVIIGDIGGSGGGTSIVNNFVRLLPNGSLDGSFNAGGIGFQMSFAGAGNVRALGIQSDGKIVVGGNFNVINGYIRFRIARLNTDSTIDESFQINTSGTGNSFTGITEFHNIAVQPDGKLIVNGRFKYMLNGVQKDNMVRLNSDGSIDSTFVVGIRLEEYFSCCVAGLNKPIIMSNGKILVGASRNSLLPNVAPIIFNSDGSVDTSFSSNLYPGSGLVYIMDIALQPDGKIIVGGYYWNTSNTPTSFLKRLNTDGSIDQTLQIPEELNKQIKALALLSNGKILIAKYDAHPVAGARSQVLRLNPDGSTDNSFNAGSGAGGKINIILALPTGKIFVGGLFSDFNGQPQGNLAQLNADGSLAPVTYSFNDEVLNLAVDNDGAVLVVGKFTNATVNRGSVSRTAFLRLIDAICPTHTRFDFDGDGRADLAAFTQSSGNWSILNSISNEMQTTQFGAIGDKTTVADFDGDSKADIAVYRPGTGIWYLLRSRDGFATLSWGLKEDKPVAADYDGDTKADIAVWRPSTGVWYILQSSNEQLLAVQFGLAGDIPLTSSDFDGDGRADIAVWRPSDGNFYWLESGAGLKFRAIHFGQTGDIPSVGDFNADGKSDLVVFRPSEGNWYQYLSIKNGGYSLTVMKFGLNGDEPVAADYDGDGKTDIAVRRQNAWHIFRSSHGYLISVFANAGDAAVAAIPTP